VDLNQKPRAVGDRAAISVGPQIGMRLQELLDQIAVGAVDLDAIKSGFNRVARTLPEALDDAGRFPLVSKRTRRSYGTGGPAAVIAVRPPPIGTAEGATGNTPLGWNEECETRPTCQSCRKISPPLA